MSDDTRHRLGARGEELAAQHLERLGFEILQRNFRTRWGELDLVALGDRTLVFCEVKTRRQGGSAGTALEALSLRKRQRIRRLAGMWLSQHPAVPRAKAIRCDLIAITFDRAESLLSLDHVVSAF
ncbi:MAG: YraN family protein [Solirubrobacteraceae bacterium]